MRSRQSVIPRALVGGLLMLAVAACGSDDPVNNNPGTAPPLPPLGSMEADLSFFDGAGGAGAGGLFESGPTAVPGPHFLTSAVAVTVARAATLVVMAVPVATFGAAVSSQPVFLGNAWHWQYSVSHMSSTFQADLTGTPLGGQQADWEMRITTTGGTPSLTNFLWYSGRSRTDGTEGEWHIFDPAQPGSSSELLQIDWDHPDATTWSLVFTNVNSQAAQTDDRLEYEVHGNTRIVRYFDASEGTTSTIQWDAVTGEGFVEAPGYNGGQRGCWDAAFEDTTCT